MNKMMPRQCCRFYVEGFELTVVWIVNTVDGGPPTDHQEYRFEINFFNLQLFYSCIYRIFCIFAKRDHHGQA